MEPEAQILVVDDEPKICELLSTYLAGTGYSVKTALDGQSALQEIEDNDFDLLLADIKMPGMDGFELIGRLNTDNRHIPVVVITGYATLDTAVQALRLGVEDYLTKPLELKELGVVVERVLEDSYLNGQSQRIVEGLQEASRVLEQHRQAFWKELEKTSFHEEIDRFSLRPDSEPPLAFDESVRKFLRACVELVAKKLNVRRASVMLRQGHWLVVKAAVREDGKDLCGKRTKLGEGLSGQVAQTGELLVVDDISRHSRFRSHKDRGYRGRSLIVAPISHQDKNLGVICATDKQESDRFTQGDVNQIQELVSYVAPALEYARLYQSLQRRSFASVQSLVAGLEAKAPHLGGHSRRVASYAVDVGRVMGQGPAQLSLLESLGQLHDVGKLAVPDRVLNKPARLTDEEFTIIMKHPGRGADIIQPLAYLGDIRPLVIHHHERPDGRGYPHGIGNDRIDVLDKIISVVDAFDAMTHARPYRDGMDPEKARDEIYSLRGKQFAAEAAEVFCDEVFPRAAHDVREKSRSA